MGSANKGREIHAEAERKGFLECETSVGNALIHMYGKSHSQEKAQKVFDKLQNRNIVSWTTLMAGYVQVGESENVFCIFDRMISECIKPDPITFVVILNACTRIGFLNKSEAYFEAMQEKYCITPTIEHETCMIDLLGRIGELQKASALIIEKPFTSNIVIWQSLLGACRNWGNVVIGRHAFACALTLDDKDGGAYYCMFNIYMDAGLWEDAQNIDAMISKKTFMRHRLLKVGISAVSKAFTCINP